MKARILSNWNLWRITRLILSLIFILNGLIKADYILLTGGVFLLIHALFNACVTCVNNNCEIPKK